MAVGACWTLAGPPLTSLPLIATRCSGEGGERGGPQAPSPSCPVAVMGLRPELGRQSAHGSDPKPGLSCPSRVGPTAASGDRTVCAGLLCPAPQVILQAALGPGLEPEQERNVCGANGGAEPVWKGTLEICRHHNPATETGGYLQSGGPRPEKRAGKGGPTSCEVTEGTPVPTGCVTLDPSVDLSEPPFPHH